MSLQNEENILLNFCISVSIWRLRLLIIQFIMYQAVYWVSTALLEFTAEEKTEMLTNKYALSVIS